MKNPIAWHKQCLANMRLGNERSKAELKRLQETVSRNEAWINDYDKQILRAELTGKEAFDSDRYGKAK
jgi:hypothetical protein